MDHTLICVASQYVHLLLFVFEGVLSASDCRYRRGEAVAETTASWRDIILGMLPVVRWNVVMDLSGRLDWEPSERWVKRNLFHSSSDWTLLILRPILFWYAIHVWHYNVSTEACMCESFKPVITSSFLLGSPVPSVKLITPSGSTGTSLLLVEIFIHTRV